MTQRVSFDPKPAAEKFEAVFGFTLATGESIDSASTVSSLYSGTDSDPGDLVSGSVSISDPEVTQLIIGGVAGNVYLLVCTALTDAPQTLIRSGFLVVT